MRINARLRLKSDSLDPDVISAQLGLVPILAYRKGEPFISGPGVYHRPWGVWQYSSKTECDVADPEKHLTLFLNTVESREKEIRSVVEQFNCTIDIRIWINTDEVVTGVTLARETLERIAHLVPSFDIIAETDFGHSEIDA